MIPIDSTAAGASGRPEGRGETPVASHSPGPTVPPVANLTSGGAGAGGLGLGGWWLLALCAWAPLAFLLLVGLRQAAAGRERTGLDLLRERLRYQAEVARQLGREDRKRGVVWAHLRGRARGLGLDSWRQQVWRALDRAGMGPRWLETARVAGAAGPVPFLAGRMQEGTWAAPASGVLTPADLVRVLVTGRQGEIAQAEGVVRFAGWGDLPLSVFGEARKEHAWFRLPLGRNGVWCAWGRIGGRPVGPGPADGVPWMGETGGAPGSVAAADGYLVLADPSAMRPVVLDRAWLGVVRRGMKAFRGPDRLFRARFRRAAAGEDVEGERPPEERVWRAGGTVGLTLVVRDAAGDLGVSGRLPWPLALWGPIGYLGWFCCSLAWLVGTYRALVAGETVWVATISRRVGLHLLPAVGLPLFGVLLVGELEIDAWVAGEIPETFRGLAQETERPEAVFRAEVRRQEARMREVLRRFRYRPEVASEAMLWGLDDLERRYHVAIAHLVTPGGEQLLPSHQGYRSVFVFVAGLPPARRVPVLARFLEDGASTNAYYLGLMGAPWSAADPRWRGWLEGFLRADRRERPVPSSEAMLRKGMGAIARQICRRWDEEHGWGGGVAGGPKVDVGAFASSMGGMDPEDVMGYIWDHLGRIAAIGSLRDRVLEMLEVLPGPDGRAGLFVMLHWKDTDLLFPAAWRLIRQMWQDGLAMGKTGGSGRRPWRPGGMAELVSVAGRGTAPRGAGVDLFLLARALEVPDLSTVALPRGVKRLAGDLRMGGQSRKLVAAFPDGTWRWVFVRTSDEFGLYVLGAARPVGELATAEIGRRRSLGGILLGLAVVLGFFAQVLRRFLFEPILDLMVFARQLGRPGAPPVPVRNAIGEWGELAVLFTLVLESLKELDVAGHLQNRLLPQGVFRRERVSIQGRSIMMEQVGGDYFDIIPDPEDEGVVYVCIGDVSGHGLAAALVMVMVGTGLRILLSFGEREPKGLLTGLNRHLVEFLRRVRMMTCEVIRIDTRTGEFQVANAGHTPVLVVSPGGGCESFLLPSMPLATVKNSRVEEVHRVVGPGGSMVLFTDGAVEAMGPDGTSIGYPRLEKALSGEAAAGFDGAVERMFRFVHQATARWDWDDDVTFVVAHFEPGVPGEPAAGPPTPGDGAGKPGAGGDPPVGRQGGARGQAPDAVARGSAGSGRVDKAGHRS
ncbi:MAG: PP2C family protein-serine/threonine phosphatase [Candidatus Riflebacteria bacterium]|nr:PP2C family protein-serine/threonine phosphatase [Candidatus Riflebacteria bacterium]